MRTVLFAVFIAFTSFMVPAGRAVCAESKTPCSFDEQAGLVYHEADVARGELAKQQIEIINKIEALVDKCKDKDLPVPEQLNPDDRAKFTALMRSRNLIDLASLLESRRMRDMEVLRKFASLAEKASLGQKMPAESSPDHIYAVMLASARQAFEGKIRRSLPETGSCTLETSIQVREQKIIDRLSNLSEKNQPFVRLAALVQDYELVKLLGRASRLIYESDKNDVVASGGNFEAMGRTLAEKADKGAYGEPMKKALALMRVIDKRIPCDDVRQAEALRRKMMKSGGNPSQTKRHSAKEVL